MSKIQLVLPVVLHHGFLSFGTLRLGGLQVSSFKGIRTAMAECGHPVIVESVHPTASIDRRARTLKQTILENLARLDRTGQRVIIFAHSMGGLDSRYMINHLGMADRVAALVTVSTPHRGSPYADWCMRNLGQRMGGLRLANLLKLDVDAIHDLTHDSCARFNEKTPDVPRVRYYSISAARPRHRVPPFYYHSHKVITDAEGDNDGLVSVQSAKWGTHLATWPVDHMHAANRRLVIEIKDPVGDVTPRYMDVLKQVSEELNDRGNS